MKTITYSSSNVFFMQLIKNIKNAKEDHFSHIIKKMLKEPDVHKILESFKIDGVEIKIDDRNISINKEMYKNFIKGEILKSYFLNDKIKNQKLKDLILADDTCSFLKDPLLKYKSKYWDNFTRNNKKLNNKEINILVKEFMKTINLKKIDLNNENTKIEYIEYIISSFLSFLNKNKYVLNEKEKRFFLSFIDNNNDFKNTIYFKVFKNNQMNEKEFEEYIDIIKNNKYFFPEDILNTIHIQNPEIAETFFKSIPNEKLQDFVFHDKYTLFSKFLLNAYENSLLNNLFPTLVYISDELTFTNFDGYEIFSKIANIKNLKIDKLFKLLNSNNFIEEDIEFLLENKDCNISVMNNQEKNIFDFVINNIQLLEYLYKNKTKIIKIDNVDITFESVYKEMLKRMEKKNDLEANYCGILENESFTNIDINVQKDILKIYIRSNQKQLSFDVLKEFIENHDGKWLKEEILKIRQEEQIDEIDFMDCFSDLELDDFFKEIELENKMDETSKQRQIHSLTSFEFPNI